MPLSKAVSATLGQEVHVTPALVEGSTPAPAEAHTPAPAEAHTLVPAGVLTPDRAEALTLAPAEDAIPGRELTTAIDGTAQILIVNAIDQLFGRRHCNFIEF